MEFPILRGRLLKSHGGDESTDSIEFPILRGRLLKNPPDGWNSIVEVVSNP